MKTQIPFFLSSNLKTARYSLAGILFTSLAGSLLHFVFGWSKGHPLAALVAPVNESVWEHLKLLFFPVLAFTAWEWARRKEEAKRLLPARLLGLLAGLIFIPLAFYAYTCLLGIHLLWADLVIFFLAVILTFLVGFLLESKGHFAETSGHAAPHPARTAGGRFLSHPAFSHTLKTVLFCLILLFILFTFRPPRLPLFRDPASGTYGYFQN
jgi:small-conductance mechanosensitive channel